MAATTSGFLVKDVVEALNKRIETHEYDHVCLMVADLVCSKQVRRLVSLLIAAVSDRYLGRNLALVENVCDRLEAVQRWRFDSRSRSVRAALMEVSLILAREQGMRLSFERFLIAREEQQPEDDLIPRSGPPAGSMVVAPPSDHEVRRIAHELYDALVAAASRVLAPTADPFVRVARWLHRSFSLDDVGTHANVMETTWELVAVFVRCHRGPLLQRYVDACRRLYWVGLTKARRKERANLLWGCAYMAAKDKQVFSESDVPLDPTPRYDLDAIFREIEGGNDDACSTTVQKAVSPARRDKDLELPVAPRHAVQQPDDSGTDADEDCGDAMACNSNYTKAIVGYERPCAKPSGKRRKCRISEADTNKLQYLMYYSTVSDAMPCRRSLPAPSFKTLTIQPTTGHATAETLAASIGIARARKGYAP